MRAAWAQILNELKPTEIALEQLQNYSVATPILRRMTDAELLRFGKEEYLDQQTPFVRGMFVGWIIIR